MTNPVRPLPKESDLHHRPDGQHEAHPGDEREGDLGTIPHLGLLCQNPWVEADDDTAKTGSAPDRAPNTSRENVQGFVIRRHFL